MKKYIVLLPALLLAACSGDSGKNNQPESMAASKNHTVIDPNPIAGNRFGIRAVELSNGNIAIRSRGFSVGSGAGAVHLYNPSTKAIINSFYGDALNYELGLTLKPLTNGNLVIASPLDHPNGVSDAGSVMLIDGNTGDQIGSTIVGNNPNDRIGGTSITALTNGNFVIASRDDSINSLNKAGSVMLINGATGVQIGSTIYGDNDFDNIGDKVKELANGNFVVASPQADDGGSNGTGSVFLVDGTTGLQIGSTVVGDHGGDLLAFSGVFALDNGNYVIASPNDDIDDGAGGVFVDAGSAVLYSGVTGLQIAAITGDQASDKVSNGGILSLANNEFMLTSTSDVIGGNSNAGSVKFYNAVTGAQIGATHNGTGPDNYYGSGSKFQLSNGNIVIASPFLDFGFTDTGRVDLINGTTKALISEISPQQFEGKFGSAGVRDLKNGNFAVVSPLENNMTVADVGSVRVYNSTTGAQLGSTVFGDDAGDQLGNAGVKALENGNFIVASKFDDVNGVSNAGSVMLFDGATGTQVGITIAGVNANDELAKDGIFALKGSNNYVIASSKVDANGMTDVGSVLLADGSTGAQIGNAAIGDDASDLLGGKVGFGDTNIIALSNGDYLITNIANDDNGNADVGKVLYRDGQ